MVAGLDPAHGGPSYSVPRLSVELARAGAEVKLLSVSGEGEPGQRSNQPGLARGSFRQSWGSVPIAASLRLSAGLDRALKAEAPRADVVHNHGLWLAPNLAAWRAAKRARRPFVCSPRGMLSPEALAFSALKKKVVWRLGQRAALAGAACLHATSEAEHAAIRACGLRTPVAIVPNGVDLPPPLPADARPEDARTLLFLGRVHPKKGLETLLQAWARVQDLWPGWRLRIVGPPERGHDDALRRLAAGLGLQRWSLEGPAYGEAKAGWLAGADLFVLPTRNENFGLAVAEALAAGLPVVCSKGAPWAGVVAEGCGWWVDHGPDALAAALDEAMSAPPGALAAMGARGRDWMARDYSWERVARDMLQVYAWLSLRGERPWFVRTD